MTSCTRYTPAEINYINDTTTSTIQLPQQTLDMISTLAEQVGAPSYVKTPQFNKDRKKRIQPNNGNEEWAVLRNFKTTEIISHNNAIDKVIDNIRMSINKMTDENKTERIEEIKKYLCDIKSNENYDENICKISKIVFDIACSNKFYSRMYALLLSELITVCPEMKSIFDTNLSEYLKLYEKIEYIDANIDYDKFCVVNKINENRRALSAFMFNLVDQKIIANIIIHNLLDNMKYKVDTMLKQSDPHKKYIIDETMENIMIFITSKNAQTLVLETYENKSELLSYIKMISLMNISNNKATYPGLSSKLIFKCEDILDILEDDED
jgi:hypothetical protein